MRRRFRPSRLSPGEQADLDARLFAELFARFSRWDTRALKAQMTGTDVPEPPCFVPRSFAKLLPRACKRRTVECEIELALATERLQGRGLVRLAPRGARDAPMCLIPVRKRR